MKKYILVAIHPTNSMTVFNTALYHSKKEAEHFKKWFVTKNQADNETANKFWGKTEQAHSLNLQVVEVEIEV